MSSWAGADDLLVWMVGDKESTGLWQVFGKPPHRRKQMLYLDDLPEELRRQFKEWIARYLTVDGAVYDEEGRRVARRLKAFVGGNARVTFRNEYGHEEEVI